MKRILVLSLLCYSLLIGGVVQAQSQYDFDFVGPKQDPLARYGAVAGGDRCGPQFNGDYILCQSTGGIISQTQTNFAAFLREMYNLAFILAGTVAFIRIVYGGILYSWSGVVDRKKEAINIFKNVAYGIALLMGSYVVLNTINPALTILALPNVTMGTPRSSRNDVPTLPLSSLNEMPSELDLLDTSIESIRQENVNRINALDIYNSGTREQQATIDLINNEINQIGVPDTPEQDRRLAELQGMLIQINQSEAQIEADVKSVTDTPPKQFQRTKTAP